MRVFLIGATGQVGYELHRSLACLGHIIAITRQELDLTDTVAIAQAVDSLQPDIIVNAAAYTAVDKAEDEQELAFAINAKAPEVLAKLASNKHIPLIHYSTDYVFNGQNNRPWKETDVTAPLGIYGQSKLEGEFAIEQSGCQYLIFRTSWVYGSRGHNFLLTMRRLAAARDQLSVVEDQVGSPTWSRHIADATALVLSQSLQNTDFWNQHSGLYHLTGSGQTSWHGFAKEIFEFMAISGTKIPELSAITTDQYPTPAKRPAYSCLDNSKLHQHFGLSLPNWQDSLQLVMNGISE